MMKHRQWTFLTRQLCSQTIGDLQRPAIVDAKQARNGIEAYLRHGRNYIVDSLWALDSGGPPAAEAERLKALATTQPQPSEKLVPSHLPLEGYAPSNSPSTTCTN